MFEKLKFDKKRGLEATVSTAARGGARWAQRWSHVRSGTRTRTSLVITDFSGVGGRQTRTGPKPTCEYPEVQGS